MTTPTSPTRHRVGEKTIKFNELMANCVIHSTACAKRGRLGSRAASRLRQSLSAGRVG
ncbi:hypothetical protein GCM10020216_108560 [Nonomuraea helvata]